MKFIAGSILVLAVLVACGGNETLAIIPTPVGSSEGQRLYIAKGCAACHGSRQEGSVVAPSITGYTADRIKQQVRAPIGAMPIFPPSKISNPELDHIARYVESLGDGNIFVKSDDLNQHLFQQHWLILISLAEGSPEEAIRYTDNIIGVVSGPHQSQMIQLRNDIETGNLHSAVHSVERMLTGVQESDSDFLGIRIKLTRNAAQAGDAATAAHYLSHASISVGSVNALLNTQIANIQGSLDSGDLSNAVRELEELISD